MLLVIDAILINLAVIVALLLRFEGAVPAEWWGFYGRAVIWLTPFLLLFNWTLGLYNRVWEYARSEAVGWILLAVSLTVAFGAMGLWYTSGGIFSSSIIVMTWALTLLLIGGSRFGWRQMRLMHCKRANGCNGGDRERIIIYGAGYTGASFARQFETSSEDPYVICGFVDDNAALKGMIVSGHKVLGTGEDLTRLVEILHVDLVVIAAPSASGAALRKMIDSVAASGAEVRTLPRLLEVVQGEVSSQDVRHVRYEDLLGRDMTDINLELDPNYIAGRRVMVTGAGGSIGSEICRQLCRYGPAELLLLGRGENRIHAILRDLRQQWPGIEFKPIICNFTNGDHVDEVFDRYRPEVVFHAGAHKHVYLMEMHPTEAIRNNVVGTGNLARAADRTGVERFVAISTDKAVEPCNVMGGSKRLCELLIRKMDDRSQTKFMAVRFGNVIGSSGSVLTIFQKQAASGHPLTVTDRHATRFFMTVEEAAFLVLHSGILGDGGDIFVLDMGEPICIYEMAREFLQLNGRDPDEPGAINITQLSPGEKVHERLNSSREELEPTSCRRVMRVAPNGALELDLSASELMSRAIQATTSPMRAQALLDAVCNPAEVSRKREEPVVMQATGE